MRYRQLGATGLAVSVVTLGTNNFGMTADAAQSRALVDACLEAGITTFDTCESYGGDLGSAEELLGLALEGRRDQAVVCTQVASFSLSSPSVAPASRRAIRQSVERSLRRLRMDHVDVLYMHQPDARTPIEETLAAMDELVSEGKARYHASANLKAWQLVEAQLVATARFRTRFVASQNAYSLVDRHAEEEILPVCGRYGIGFSAYFPLAHGLLTGKYRRGEAAPPGTRLAARRQHVLQDERAFDAVEQLEAFARERGLTLLQVALGGLAAKPGVSSITAGASRPEQVAANAAASDWVPSPEDEKALDEIARPEKYVPLGSRTGHRR